MRSETARPAMGDGDYYVSLPYATFRRTVRAGRVSGAAPVAGWALGKPGAYVLEYYRRKGATIERIA